MAQFGDAKYTLSMKFRDSEDLSSTKTISGINYNGTSVGGGSSALGADVDSLYELAGSIHGGIITGGSGSGYLDEIKLVDEKPIERGEG